MGGDDNHRALSGGPVWRCDDIDFHARKSGSLFEYAKPPDWVELLPLLWLRCSKTLKFHRRGPRWARRCLLRFHGWTEVRRPRSAQGTTRLPTIVVSGGTSRLSLSQLAQPGSLVLERVFRDPPGLESGLQSSALMWSHCQHSHGHDLFLPTF